MAIVINLFGAPSAGKSTGAAYVFSKLKMAGVNAELVTEFAKDKTWEHNTEALKNQAYMFGNQYYRISRCAEKVDVIVTDSPLPLSIVYNTDINLGNKFNEVVLNVFKSFNNLNFYIQRVKPYNPVGRNQSEEESNQLNGPILNLLLNNYLPYKQVNGDEEGYDYILEYVLDFLKNQTLSFSGDKYDEKNYM